VDRPPRFQVNEKSQSEAFIVPHRIGGQCTAKSEQVAMDQRKLNRKDKISKKTEFGESSPFPEVVETDFDSTNEYMEEHP